MSQAVIHHRLEVTSPCTDEECAGRQMARQMAAVTRISNIVLNGTGFVNVARAVTDIVADLIGARFGRFLFNPLHESGYPSLQHSLSDLEELHAEGSIIKRHSPLFQAVFLNAHTVRSRDVREDSHFVESVLLAELPPNCLPIASYLAIPIASRDDGVLGALFFSYDQPGGFADDAVNLVQGMLPHIAMALDNARLGYVLQKEIETRRKGEQAREILLAEIQHRVKNTLATVQAIVGQTLRSSPLSERKAFGARLQALAGAHDVLTRHNWDRAAIGSIIERVLTQFGERFRVQFDVNGPEVGINAARATLLAIILHELCTNAAKYGALSTEHGRVSITWDTNQPVSNETCRCVILVWREFGGPKVSAPQKKGFGCTLIERALEGNHGNSHLEYAQDGVICTLRITL